MRETVACATYLVNNQIGCISFFCSVFQARLHLHVCCAALQAGDSARVARSITLHKAEQRRLISPHLYSQKLNIIHFKVSKWFLCLKGLCWSTEHDIKVLTGFEQNEHSAQLSVVSNRQGGVQNKDLVYSSKLRFIVSVCFMKYCNCSGNVEKKIYFSS